MVQLLADPWRPDLGAGAESSLDDDGLTNAVVDTDVETSRWDRPLRPEPCPPEPVTFVDGVMRSELRVLARDGDARAWGVLGSFAAGGVLCDGTATFVAEDGWIRRALFLGSRVQAPAIQLRVGNSDVVYQPQPVADDTPTGLRRALQRQMLASERDLATTLARDTLVFADGPLHLDEDTALPVVGVVKRMVTRYLPTTHETLLPQLQPGERTPLFALGNNLVDRYAWYIRPIQRAAAWHELAALIRCEVRMGIGLDRARHIADLVACHLPQYAGRPGIDPRAPQNLTPVGALEARLKHRLGSSTLLARALMTYLCNGGSHE